MTRPRHRRAAFWLLVSTASCGLATGAAAQYDATPAEPLPEVAPPSTEAPLPDAGSPMAEGEPPRLIIQPRIGLTETLTDNARGGAGAGSFSASGGFNTGGKRSGDLITRVSPGIFVSDNGPRTRFTLDYQANFDKYIDNTDLDDVRHALTATGNAEVLRELLFVDTGASISHELIDNRGAIVGTDRGVPGNESMVSTFYISPSLRNFYGPWAQSELRYTFGFTDSSDANSDATRNQFGLRFSSGPAFNRFLWSAIAEYADTTTGTQTLIGTAPVPATGPEGDLTRTTLLFSPGYIVSRELTVFGGIGWEETKSDTLATNTTGLIWSAGVELTPGPRSKLRLAYNDRFGGHFVSADGSYEFDERSRLTLTYNESIATQQDIRFNNLLNAGTGFNGTSFIDKSTGLPFNPLNPGTGASDGFGDAAFHQKLGRVALVLDRNKNSYLAAFTYDERQSDEQIPATETVYTAEFGVTRSLNPFSSVGLNLQYYRVEDNFTGEDRKDDIYRSLASFSYDLSESLRSTLSYVFLYRNSSIEGQSTHENTLILSFIKTF